MPNITFVRPNLKTWPTLKCRNALAFDFTFLTHLYYFFDACRHVLRTIKYSLLSFGFKKSFAKLWTIFALELATFGSLWCCRIAQIENRISYFQNLFYVYCKPLKVRITFWFSLNPFLEALSRSSSSWGSLLSTNKTFLFLSRVSVAKVKWVLRLSRTSKFNVKINNF